MTTTAEYEGFNNISNKEWIWGSPQTLSQSDASYNFYYLDATYVGAYSSFMADPHLMDTFVKGDIRLPLFNGCVKDIWVIRNSICVRMILQIWY